jgi:hypothetical protein
MKMVSAHHVLGQRYRDFSALRGSPRDWSGIRKRLLRIDDLLATFDELRGADLLDASAAGRLERQFV